MQDMLLVPAGQDGIPHVHSGMGSSGKTFSGVPTEVAKTTSAFIRSITIIGATAFRYY